MPVQIFKQAKMTTDLSLFTKFRRLALKFKGLVAELNPLQQYLVDGWDAVLYRSHLLDSESLVVVVGAYEGESVGKWRELFDSRVIGLEPVRSYAAAASRRFQSDKKVEILNFGLGSSHREVDFKIDSDATGLFIKSSPGNMMEKVQIQDVNWFLNEYLQARPDIMEINIEGGEYELLERLLNSRSTNLFPKVLLVQFHMYSESDLINRQKIRSLLTSNYSTKFNYDWVWERWDLNQP